MNKEEFEDRLLRAIINSEKLPDRERPSLPKCVWPEYRNNHTAYGYGTPTPAKLSPEEVSDISNLLPCVNFWKRDVGKILGYKSRGWPDREIARKMKASSYIVKQRYFDIIQNAYLKYRRVQRDRKTTITA